MKNSISIIALMLFFMTSLMAQSKFVKETIMYSVKDGQELKFDKYEDKSVKTKGKRPAMIYVHGGGFSMGSRVNALQIKYNKYFATKGYVSISIDYRLGIKAGEQANQKTVLNAVNIAVEDLFNVTKYVLDNATKWNIDPTKIMISGGSAGAITCLNAEYEIVNAGALAKILPANFNYAGIISQAGCVIAAGQDTLKWNNKPCPIFFMHGDIDQAVPFENYSLEKNLYAGSNYIHKQFIEAKIPHSLYVEKGADHIIALKPLQYNFEEIDSFIKNYVMGGKKSILETTVKEEIPGSMAKMFDIVPLYMSGWDKTDDEVEKGAKK